MFSLQAQLKIFLTNTHTRKTLQLYLNYTIPATVMEKLSELLSFLSAIKQ